MRLSDMIKRVSEKVRSFSEDNEDTANQLSFSLLHQSVTRAPSAQIHDTPFFVASLSTTWNFAAFESKGMTDE